jgi:uncharacterized protein (TIGR02646 family)
MRRVLEQPSGGEFDAWNLKAGKACAELIKAWKEAKAKAEEEGHALEWKAKINDDLYKEFRQVFLNKAFDLKCAYCECMHSDGFPITVEHYRPKGAVTDHRVPVAHPGYFWLAYQWWNLVPSCANCNTTHTDQKSAKKHQGKLNEFPIHGARVNEPSDNPENWLAELAAEEPDLLNPYFDDPEQHLDFDFNTGVPVHKSDRGRATIETCDLDRLTLAERRLSLKADSLVSLILRLFASEPIESIVPASAELSLWRKSMIRGKLAEMVAGARPKAS